MTLIPSTIRPSVFVYTIFSLNVNPCFNLFLEPTSTLSHLIEVSCSQKQGAFEGV